MRYIKQFDTIRAFAVLLVIVSHWVPAKAIRNGPLGPMGVTLFFVLSGFLITSILFHQRNSDLVPTSRLLKNFYARRTLRIFPIYYLTLLVVFICQRYSETQIGSSVGYHFFYLSNVYFYKTNAWDGLLSPLWSLSVEEQFYLIWPWVILLLPKRYFLPAILSFISMGIIGQLYFHGNDFGVILTFTCFDAFGIGALLAWFTIYKKEALPKFYAWSKRLALVAGVIFAIQVYQPGSIPLQRTAVSVMAVWMICFILIHEKNLPFKAIWNNKILIYLGKISYGLYLYHLVTHQMITLNLLDKYVNPLLPASLTRHHKAWLLLEDSVVLLLVASLSYYLIEKRFLSLKRYFEPQTPAGSPKSGKTVRPVVITNQSVGL